MMMLQRVMLLQRFVRKNIIAAVYINTNFDGWFHIYVVNVERSKKSQVS